MTSLQSTGGVSFRSVANPKCCTHSISYQHWWWLPQHSWPETMRLLGQNYRKERQKRISSEHPTALPRPSSVETSTINMLGVSQVVSAFLIKTTSCPVPDRVLQHCLTLSILKLKFTWPKLFFIAYGISGKAETSTLHSPFIPSSTVNQANSSICINFSETQLKAILLLHFHIKLFHID